MTISYTAVEVVAGLGSGLSYYLVIMLYYIQEDVCATISTSSCVERR